MGDIRTVYDLAGLPDNHTVSFPPTLTTIETATITLTVGELKDALTKDGYRLSEGDVQLFGVDTIHKRLRRLFEAKATVADNELTLDE